MGLDWNPIGKPKPGYEEEFERLFHMLVGNPQNEGWLLEKIKHVFGLRTREAASKRWFEIQISPFVTIQAPQVGEDPRADEYARQRYREKPPKNKSEEQFLEELKGHYVVALATPCDGIPVYSNGPFGYVELFSFRAQWIVIECRDIVGYALIERCYRSYLARDLMSLGKDVLERAAAYAAKHGVSGVEGIRVLDAPKASPEAKAHILFSAAKWCEYWSSRGHGLEACF